MKIKNFFAFFMVIIILMILTSCGEKKNNTNKTNPPDLTVKDTGKKIEGTITGASIYSEGLAFVCLEEENETTYCINNKGNIVFKIDKKLDINGQIYNCFVNGLTIIDGAICDTTGKLTMPEDVGATKFYDIAFSGGYILAEKVTSDYASTKKELGVMNKNFEWVLQPSEKLYNDLEEGLLNTESLNTESFYSNGTIYFEDCRRYLNVKTGEVSETSNIKHPSSSWSVFSDGFGAYKFGDDQENIFLDLSEKGKIFKVSGFKNSKCAVIFNNQDAGKYYLTVIDETGSFIFEPVEIKGIPNVTDLVFDGNYIVVAGEEMRSGDYVEIFQCYDSAGKVSGLLDTGELGKNRANSCYVGDGVILVSSGYNYSHLQYYYKPDFTPLF